MSTVLLVLRRCIEPVIGVAFLLLWINAEVGRGVTGLAVMALFAVAIGLSRFAPFVALGLIAATLGAQAATLLPRPGSTDWPYYFGVAIVVGLIAATGRVVTRWIALAAAIVVAPAIAALMMFQPDGWMDWTGQGWSGLYSPSTARNYWMLAGLAALVAALVWGCGYGLSAQGRLFEGRLTAARMERELELSEVELAVAQERNRIAHEMHDVLAHSLAVVIAQADGARYIRPSKPRAVDSALQNIAESARSALTDVRGIIDGILDGTALPQPGFDDLPTLIEGMRSTGLEVALTEAGERQPLAAMQQVALYRIVQESLTNALRHRGRGSSVAVVFDWRGSGVSLLVQSSGGNVGEQTPERVGRGVIGMRERAHVAGGWLTAGLEDDGVHLVSAYIPFYFAERGTLQLEVS